MDVGVDVENQEKIIQLVSILDETPEKARQFLEATNWELEEAIQLYYADSEARPITSSSPSIPLQSVPSESEAPSPAAIACQPELAEDYVRPPLPVKREALYDDSYLYRAHWLAQRPAQRNAVDAFRNFEEEARYKSQWESDSQGSSSGDASKANLASLYRPPFELMFEGDFEQAKVEASRQGKWLLVNIQSTKEFNSHMLNRDTWANEAVKETISSSFVFWQVYDDTEDGRKVCTYYHLNKLPAILVIDPVTGQKMRAWNGMVDPERLLEDLMTYMDKGPLERHPTLPHKKLKEVDSRPAPVGNADRHSLDDELQQALAASMEGLTQPIDENGAEKAEEKQDDEEKAVAPSKIKPCYPTLPVEPEADKAQVCRVGVRFPDGTRVQRRFLHSDSIQLLWSLCCSENKEAEQGREFKLVHNTFPGGSTSLDFNSNINFGDSGFCNSIILMTWV